MPKPSTAKAKMPPMIGGQPIQPWLGAPVATPGIYSGMPIDFYHGKNAAVEVSVSSGNLRTICSKSPAHYWAESPYNEARIEDENESEALLLGRAAHYWFLEQKGQGELNDVFAVAPDNLPDPDGVRKPFSYRRAVCKEWAKMRREEGRTVLLPKHQPILTGMLFSLQRHPVVMDDIEKIGLLEGYPETSWFYKHRATGVWIKCRPDSVPQHSMMFADLKTCRSVDWHALQSSVFEYGYDIQAGLLAMAVKEITGQRLESFTLVFVEKEPPYDVAVMILKSEEIELGALAAEKAIRQFAECYQSGVWPGRYKTELYLEMNQWQRDARKRYAEA